MAPLDVLFYVKPNTITDLTLWIDGVQATESSFSQQVSGDYILCNFYGHSGTHNVLKASRYEDLTIELYDGPASYYEMTPETPKTYISSITHDNVVYTIKDAEARETLTNKQDTLVSGTNIKTINSTSILGSGNISTPDTKNTAGSTNTSSKIFLIGATSQGANPQTYSHDTVFVGTDGALNSNTPSAGDNSTKVATTAWVTTEGFVKKDGGSSQQTIQLSSGTGTTALGLKSRSTSSYLSLSGTSGWLGSYGATSDKKPTFYNGTSYILATTNDINDAILTIQLNGTNVETFSANASSNKTANIQATQVVWRTYS